jgi:hypothetical protein
MSDIAFSGDLPPYGNTPAKFRPPAVENVPNRLSTEANMAKIPTITMSTFQWIIGILLAAIVGLLSTIGLIGGSYMNGIQTDIREVRKDVTEIRVQASATNTKLDDLTAEVRRRFPR